MVNDRNLAHGNDGLNGVVNIAGGICDHASPPPGMRWVCLGTSDCNCHLEGTPTGGEGNCGTGTRWDPVLKKCMPAGVATGAGSGSGGVSNGTSGGTGTASGGNSTGGGTTTTPATSSAVQDQIKAGIIVAVILWAAKHFLK